MKHSPLGFSGAERWVNCPGSVALTASLPPDTAEEDPDYRRAGTAAHAAWAFCLREGLDAWEVGDAIWEGWSLSAEELTAGQLYLDTARRRLAEVSAEQKSSVVMLVEAPFRAPAIHELAYGTLDLALIADRFCDLTDYKHGEGIFVPVEHNWQLMGYAAMVRSRFPFIEHFRLRIVQPRCAGTEPVREWDISAAEIREWVESFLRPAMNRAAAGGDLLPGAWCRFCKAKLSCPALLDLPAVIEHPSETISDARLGEMYAKIEPLKIMAKAIEAEVLRRRLMGVDVPGSKTVAKKTFRVWKEAAQTALLAALGPDVMQTALKGPAEVEKMGSNAKALVAEYAYSPDAGYTVAPLDDRRKAVALPAPDPGTFDNFLIDKTSENV